MGDYRKVDISKPFLLLEHEGILESNFSTKWKLWVITQPGSLEWGKESLIKWVGVLLGHGFGLSAVEKITSFTPCWQSNPNVPTLEAISIPSGLSWMSKCKSIWNKNLLDKIVLIEYKIFKPVAKIEEASQILN